MIGLNYVDWKGNLTIVLTAVRVAYVLNPDPLPIVVADSPKKMSGKLMKNGLRMMS